MRYATKKEVNELRDILLKLTEQVNEIAKWQAYYSIKENVDEIPQNLRKEIIEQSKGHITHLLYKKLLQ